MTYKNILNKYIQYTEKTKKTFLEGLDSFHNLSELLDDYFFRGYLTAKQYEKAKAEFLTFEDVKALMVKKYDKKLASEIEKKRRHFETIANAEPIDHIELKVEWKRSQTWGLNPSCECWANEYTTGKASGCGYDKLSAATAEAMNKNTAILKLLFDKYEQTLETNPEASLRQSLGYGSGYILPFFEGGVGFSSHQSIFEGLGFSVLWSEGKMWDYMLITKKRDNKWIN